MILWDISGKKKDESNVTIVTGDYYMLSTLQ